jgi:hypothetical protein
VVSFRNRTLTDKFNIHTYSWLELVTYFITVPARQHPAGPKVKIHGCPQGRCIYEGLTYHLQIDLYDYCYNHCKFQHFISWGLQYKQIQSPALILSPPWYLQLVATSETYITKWGEKNHVMPQSQDNPSWRSISLANLYWDAWSDDSCRPKRAVNSQIVALNLAVTHVSWMDDNTFGSTCQVLCVLQVYLVVLAAACVLGGHW